MIDDAEVAALLPMYRESYVDNRQRYEAADEQSCRWLAWADVADRFAVRIADRAAAGGTVRADTAMSATIKLYVLARDRFRAEMQQYRAAIDAEIDAADRTGPRVYAAP